MEKMSINIIPELHPVFASYLLLEEFIGACLKIERKCPYRKAGAKSK
jgi:hypothetical protein